MSVTRREFAVSYQPVVAAALSGATLRQLSYWRSSRSTEAPLLAPELHKPRSRVSYSFRDVVALRTFVYLRSRKVPLQRVRKAVRSLRDMGRPSGSSSLAGMRSQRITLRRRRLVLPVATAGCRPPPRPGSRPPGC
ncbi:MAG: MerR family transcriptional regulator, partial [Pseudonocardiales bacterium]